MRARSHQPPGRGPLVAHAARGSTTSKTLMLGRCRQYRDPRLLEVTEERSGPSGLRDDDDDDDCYSRTFRCPIMNVLGELLEQQCATRYPCHPANSTRARKGTIIIAIIIINNNAVILQVVSAFRWCSFNGKSNWKCY